MSCVLITGATGFLGSHTAVSLSEHMDNLVLLDNLSTSNIGVLDKIYQIIGREIPYICGDVIDANLLEKTLRKYKVNAVVHFAGFKSVAESTDDPLRYYENNVVGTASLVRAMEQCSVKKLVFSSSATVYGEPTYLPLDELHPTSVESPYARTKLHIEEFLTDIANAKKDWKIVSLRYFNPIGAHESGLIGDNPNHTPNNLMPYLVQVASGERDELKVFGSDYQTRDGTGVRDYVHVDDLAEGHVAALEFADKNSGHHIFNLGSGIGYSVHEVVDAFERVSGLRIPLKMVGRRKGDVAEYYADAKKARRVLGWQTRRTIEDMCRTSWHFKQKLNDSRLR
ncbi:UDP-glucose 4-epimerase GalE [Burkholderiales bacterium]|nr:UDP-glucose 4-epimerase GalE [Burkholderiales bacterium]